MEGAMLRVSEAHNIGQRKMGFMLELEEQKLHHEVHFGPQFLGQGNELRNMFVEGASDFVLPDSSVSSNHYAPLQYPDSYQMNYDIFQQHCNEFSQQYHEISLPSSDFYHQYHDLSQLHHNLYQQPQGMYQQQPYSSAGSAPLSDPLKSWLENEPMGQKYGGEMVDLRVFHCEVCGKGYTTRRALRQHESKGHHPCTWCGKMLLSRRGLADHLHLHTGERPYLCDRCTSSFVRLRDLQRHRKLQHSAPPESVILRGLLGEASTTLAPSGDAVDPPGLSTAAPVSGSQPHRCRICYKAFVRMRDLQHHLQQRHAGVEVAESPAQRGPLEDVSSGPELALGNIVCPSVNGDSVSSSSLDSEGPIVMRLSRCRNAPEQWEVLSW